MRAWGSGGRRPAVADEPMTAALASAIDRAATGGWDALDGLLGVLAEVDDRGDDAAGRWALDALGRLPKVLARLDEHARRVRWSSPYHPAVTRLAARLNRSAVGPVALAVASSHGDGRVRERAVRAILADPRPELVPFLVLRTGDWVRQVRDRARAGLALLLADDPAAYLPVTLPMAMLLGARTRGGFVTGQVTAALLTAPEPVREDLARSGPTAQRRLLFDLDLAHGHRRLDDLAATAASDPDVRIRARAAEYVCREAVWTGRIPTLHRLARSARPETRMVALAGLLRLGQHADVVAHLDDGAPLVRAIAREAARRAGTDALARLCQAARTWVPERRGPQVTAAARPVSDADRAAGRPTHTRSSCPAGSTCPNPAWPAETPLGVSQRQRPGLGLLRTG